MLKFYFWISYTHSVTEFGNEDYNYLNLMDNTSIYKAKAVHKFSEKRYVVIATIPSYSPILNVCKVLINKM